METWASFLDSDDLRSKLDALPAAPARGWDAPVGPPPDLGGLARDPEPGPGALEARAHHLYHRAIHQAGAAAEFAEGLAARRATIRAAYSDPALAGLHCYSMGITDGHADMADELARLETQLRATCAVLQAERAARVAAEGEARAARLEAEQARALARRPSRAEAWRGALALAWDALATPWGALAAALLCLAAILATAR